ncbi:MAG TPA: chromosomal replication initiator protein DnaA [Candidatus Saccharimonadia bacterium]|nr:chromosomal replication initiator protein DnaA [Candidatus Saccharimonadia bacterium]
MQDSLWQAVLGEIEISVSHASYITWFKQTCLLRNKNSVVVIGVPNVFIKQQLERKYNQLIIDLLKKNGVAPESIHYKIHSFINDQEVTEIVEEEEIVAYSQPTPSHLTSQSGGYSHNYRQGLNEKYTFDNFVVGSSNELAYAACMSISNLPGTKYNPLFIYGGVGIGKTHLIQAVGNSILKNQPSKKVVYVTSEQFVQEFVDALRFKKTNEFTNNYRGADVLIIDDVQFIAGKEKVQEEFFHTFNVLHQANKQIIISSDRQPREIPTLEERLSSRFAWGMTIDMQTPDFETRCAIIQTKAHEHKVPLDNEIVEYLAGLIQTNIRELEGVLNQLLAFCEMRDIQPTIEIATSLLSGSQSRPKHINPKQVIDRTAKHFHIPVDEMMGPKRDQDIVVPRQVAMYILRSELHLSFPKIAHELGRKDHTTAIHSVDKIEEQINLNGDIRSAVKDIKEKLYA